MSMTRRAQARLRLRRRNRSSRSSRVVAVWEKGFATLGYDAAMFRKDKYGALMKRSEYGNRESPYGWEIDHIVPESKGGGSDMDNLRPLNWETKVRRRDEFTSVG